VVRLPAGARSLPFFQAAQTSGAQLASYLMGTGGKGAEAFEAKNSLPFSIEGKSTRVLISP